MELSERQRKRARDNARIARWADENALQTSTTTAPGGLELERLWPDAPLNFWQQQRRRRRRACA